MIVEFRKLYTEEYTQRCLILHNSTTVYYV